MQQSRDREGLCHYISADLYFLTWQMPAHNIMKKTPSLKGSKRLKLSSSRKWVTPKVTTLITGEIHCEHHEMKIRHGLISQRTCCLRELISFSWGTKKIPTCLKGGWEISKMIQVSLRYCSILGSIEQRTSEPWTPRFAKWVLNRLSCLSRCQDTPFDLDYSSVAQWSFPEKSRAPLHLVHEIFAASYLKNNTKYKHIRMFR